MVSVCAQVLCLLTCSPAPPCPPGAPVRQAGAAGPPAHVPARGGPQGERQMPVDRGVLSVFVWRLADTSLRPRKKWESQVMMHTSCTVGPTQQWQFRRACMSAELMPGLTLPGLTLPLCPISPQVLIFSQMTRMLDLLQSFLDQKGHSACRLDGSVAWQVGAEEGKGCELPGASHVCCPR